MTSESNAAIAVTSPWDQATLLINGKEVERGAKVVLLRGQVNVVTVEAPPAIARELRLVRVNVDDLVIDAEPVFNKWVPADNGKFEWRLKPGDGKSGRITLVFFSREETKSWEHPSLVLSSNLAHEVEVWIGGKATSGGAVFFRGWPEDVVLKPKPDSPIEGYPIALRCIANGPLQPTDFSSEPPFEIPDTTHKWRVTGTNYKSGYFQLQVFSQGLTPISVTANKLLSNNLAEEVDVEIDGKSVPSRGNVFIRGQAQELTLHPKPGSPIAGHNVTLTCKLLQGLSEGDIQSAPPFGGVGGPNWNWQLTGYNRSGTFEISVVGQGLSTPIRIAVSKLLSSNLMDEAFIKIDGVEISNNDVPYLKSSKRVITLDPKPGSPLGGTLMSLRWVRGDGMVAQDLSVTPNLNTETATYYWDVSSSSEKYGTFELGLFMAGHDRGLALPVNRKIITKYWLNDKEISGVQTVTAATVYNLHVEVSTGVSRIYADGTQGEYTFAPSLNNWFNVANGRVSWTFGAAANRDPKQTVFFDYSSEYPAREKVEFVRQ